MQMLHAQVNFTAMYTYLFEHIDFVANLWQI